MRLTVLALDVANPADPAVRGAVEFLVDSGAVYSFVPRDALSGSGSRLTHVSASGWLTGR